MTADEPGQRGPMADGVHPLAAAHLLIQAGRAGEAAALLAPVLAGSPTDAEVWLLHATAARLSGRLDAAATSASRAVRLDPVAAGPRAELATILAAQGLDDEARFQLERALAADPHNRWCLRTAWYVELAGGRPEAAVANGRRLVASDPSDPTAHRDLGAALLAAGRREEAEASLRWALQLDPSDPAALRALARALESPRPGDLLRTRATARRKGEAMELYVAAGAADPDHGVARARLAALHAERRRHRSNRALVPTVVVCTALLVVAGWNAHPAAAVVAPMLFLMLVAGVVAARREARVALSPRVEQAGAAAGAWERRQARAGRASGLVEGAGWALLALAFGVALVRFDLVARQSNPVQLMAGLALVGSALVLTRAMWRMRPGDRVEAPLASEAGAAAVRSLTGLGAALAALGGLTLAVWRLHPSAVVDAATGTALLVAGATLAVAALAIRRRQRSRRRRKPGADG